VIGLPAGTRVWLVAGMTDMRGDLIKVLWWDGHGLCLFCKRLERGRFVWPQAAAGGIHLSAAQLSMLLEGIDWRHTVRTAPSCAA
jgi:transposase